MSHSEQSSPPPPSSHSHLCLSVSSPACVSVTLCPPPFPPYTTGTRCVFINLACGSHTQAPGQYSGAQRRWVRMEHEGTGGGGAESLLVPEVMEESGVALWIDTQLLEISLSSSRAPAVDFSRTSRERTETLKHSFKWTRCEKKKKIQFILYFQGAPASADSPPARCRSLITHLCLGHGAQNVKCNLGHCGVGGRVH